MPIRRREKPHVAVVVIDIFSASSSREASMALAECRERADYRLAVKETSSSQTLYRNETSDMSQIPMLDIYREKPNTIGEPMVRISRYESIFPHCDRKAAASDPRSIQYNVARESRRFEGCKHTTSAPHLLPSHKLRPKPLSMIAFACV